MKSINIPIVVLIIFISRWGISQKPELPSAPSATSVSLGKYADVVPNLYTGSTSFSIPIHSVSEGPLSHSVALSYHTAGIRAREISTAVGLGWSLAGGGAVYRTVRGLPDDQQNGYWLRGSEIQGNILYDLRDEIADGTLDGEMDIFAFSVPGLGSGKFVVDHLGEPHFIPKSSLDIEKFHGLFGTVQGFKITATDGTKYYFGVNPKFGDNMLSEFNVVKETSNNTAQPIVSYEATSWHLTRIESHDSLHYIDFEYEENNYSYAYRADCIQFEDFDSQSGQWSTIGLDCQMNEQQIDVRGYVLSNITTSTSEIDLSYLSDREDLQQLTVQKPKRLEEILVTEGNYSYKYALTHSYFKETPSTTDYQKKRLKLDQLQKISGSTPEPPHIFEYFRKDGHTSGSLYFCPDLTTLDIDHWGFFNDAGNTGQNNLPPTFVSVASGGGTLIGNASRHTNESKMKAGMLQKITYPLGGYTEIDYEANEYRDNISNTTSNNSISTGLSNCSAGNTASTSFFLTANQITTGYFNLDLFPDIADDGCSTTSYGVGRIIIRKNGQVVHDETYQQNENYNNKIHLNFPPGRYEENVEYQVDLIADFAILNFALVESINGQNRTVGGLRLKSVKTSDGINSTSDIIRTYKYTSNLNNDISSGVLYKKPLYGSGFNTTTAIFLSSSISPLSSFEGTFIGYNKVYTQLNGNGYTVSEFYNDHADDCSTCYYPTLPEKSRSQNGSPKLTASYKEDGTLLKSTTIVLEGSNNEDIPAKNVLAVKFDFLSGINFRKRSYTINSGIYRPSTISNYNEGVISNQSFTYDPDDAHYMAETTNTVNSDGTLYTNETTYTTDYQHHGGIRAELVNERNIIAPYKQRTLVNGVEIAVNETTFGEFGTHPRPSQNRSKVIIINHDGTVSTPSNPAEKWVSNIIFNEYDEYGMLLRSTDKGYNTSQYYNYNSNHLLTSISFGSLTETTNYFSNSRLISSKTAADGTSSSYTYDDLARLKTVKRDCNNTVTTINYNLFSSPLSKSNISTTTIYPSDPTNLSAVNNLTSIKYMDGLNRTIQTVHQGQSFDGKDQVSALEYDNQGRVYKTYETYDNDNTDGSYDGGFSSHPFTLTTFESSPLSRVLSTTLPNWASTTYSYGVNHLTDYVDFLDGSATPGHYNGSKLTKSTVIDPNGNKSVSFADIFGRTILTRRENQAGDEQLDTYYTYDLKHRQIQVLPPGSNQTETAKIYTYHYDGQDRMISKDIPGKDLITYEYDDRDLVTKMQDSYHRSLGTNHKYGYTYDNLGRELTSGLYNGISLISKMSDIQYGSSGINNGKVISSESLILGTQDYLITIPSYDNCGRSQTISSSHHLDPSNTSAIVSSVTYDGADNIIKDIMTYDILNTTTIIENSSALDKVGRAEETYFKLNNDPLVHLSTITYDEEDQMIQKRVAPLGPSQLQQCDYEYLENGLLYRMNEGLSINGDLFGFTLNYNQIPTSPNNSSGVIIPQQNGNISSIESQTIGNSAKLNLYNYDFANRLTHSFTDNNEFNTAYQYNLVGNFTHIDRRGMLNGVSAVIDDMTYSYHVDEPYQMKSIAESADQNEGYKNGSSGGDYQYDDNGNMTRDPHKGITTEYNHLDLPSLITWDDGRVMQMTYDGNGSLLQRKIIDAGGNDVQKYDFFGSIEYINDLPYVIHHAEGRLVNEGVEDYLEYLFLDHNQSFDGDFEANIIESEGNIVDNSTIYSATDYIDLKDGFTILEGAEFTGSNISVPNYTLKWRYEYNMYDHLDNLRLTYSDLNSNGTISQDEILQTQEYYPYGMPHSKSLSSALESHRQFNGIDYVKDYDLSLSMTTYRSLDGSLGTWTGVDPKAEVSKGMSPYCAMASNPISYNDPDGDYIPAAILGAGIGLVTNGIGNIINRENFFSGAGEAMLFGAAGGAASFGIGELASGISNGLGRAAFQLGAHGLSGGAMSTAQGGSFRSGFLSGSLSSGMSSGASGFIGNAGMIGIGALSGGIGAYIGGGSFWDGVGQGLITSGLNHAAHNGAFGENFQAALHTGRGRHMFNADATATTVTLDGAAGMAIGFEVGTVEAQVGPDRGIRKPLFEVGFGGGLDASAAGGVTKFYYGGKRSDFRLNWIAGKSSQINIGGSIFGKAGGSISWSNQKYNGKRIWGFGGNLGVGLPTYISGSYQQRITILDPWSKNPIY